MNGLTPASVALVLLAAVVGVRPVGAQTRPTTGAVGLTMLKIDPEHSSVGFRVRHLFTQVHGSFRELSGQIAFATDDPRRSSVSATIQAASIDTNNPDRDADLRSKRFFEVSSHPEIRFESQKIVLVGDREWRISGQLTMHGVTRTVVLEAEYLGSGKDPWGNTRYGFHAETTIDRKDFGLNWNETLETGGVLVGDEIEIVLDIEAVPI